MRENLLLGGTISLQIRVPVQMVLAQIQNRRGVRSQRWRELELKARQFKNPDGGWGSGATAFEQHL